MIFDTDVIVTIPNGSREPAVAQLDSPTGELLTAGTVEMSVVSEGAAYSWEAAGWVDTTPAATRDVETTSARTWATGTYVVHVRLDGAQIIRCSNRIQVP